MTRSKARSSVFKPPALERLWAPWRAGYVRTARSKGCIFCAARSRRQRYVVVKNTHAVAVLNLFPYNNGHLLVAPLRHVADITALNTQEIIALWEMLQRMKKLLTRALTPDGYNIGINLGDVAGAGIPGHLHIHLVPRWKGDTNFMPVVGATKVIPESLEVLCQRLTQLERKARRV